MRTWIIGILLLAIPFAFIAIVEESRMGNAISTTITTPAVGSCTCPPVAGKICYGCGGADDTDEEWCEKSTCHFIEAGTNLTCMDEDAILGRAKCVWIPAKNGNGKGTPPSPLPVANS